MIIMSKTFEENITALEETVRRLEAGDVTLDESLALFERGVKLSKECQKMLDSAEKKVNILINGEKQEFNELNEEQA